MLALASRATQLVAHRGLATASALPRKVKIYELGPRDGLQNEATQVPTDVKIEFINRLSEVGASVVEPTSFVSPKWVPQMGDHKEVLAGITMRPGVSYPVLVPNMRGFKDSVAGGAKAVAVLCMPSETFASKNLNMSVAQATERCLAIVEEAVGQSIPVRGYISCALGCPFEGPMDPKAVASLAKQLHEAGCYEIALSDTIGAGTPGDMELLLREARRRPRAVLCPRLAATPPPLSNRARALLSALRAAGAALAESCTRIMIHW